ncbi:hypothetical protein GCM10018966_014570 [Streptomyces yanii]
MAALVRVLHERRSRTVVTIRRMTPGGRRYTDERGGAPRGVSEGRHGRRPAKGRGNRQVQSRYVTILGIPDGLLSVKTRWSWV